ASNAPGGILNNPLGTGGGLNFDGGIGGLGSQLTQATGGQGAAGLINMVIGFLYPQLKLMFEASIRRLTVTVRWAEGIVPRDFELVEYITNPLLAGLTTGMPGTDGGLPSTSGTSAAGTATSRTNLSTSPVSR
ncbi:MAG: hypothetical protein ABI551_17800, partial [Polyangiaceae bacterium]